MPQQQTWASSNQEAAQVSRADLLDALHLYCLGTPLQAATGGWPVGTLLPDPSKLHLDTGHLPMLLLATRVALTGNSWDHFTAQGYTDKRKTRQYIPFAAKKPSFTPRGGGGGGGAGSGGASLAKGKD